MSRGSTTVGLHKLASSAADSAIGAVFGYIVLSIAAFVASFFPIASAIFSLFQVLLLLSDIEYADKANRMLQNFVAALVTGTLGWLLHDPLAYAGGIVVIAIIILKILDKL